MELLSRENLINTLKMMIMNFTLACPNRCSFCYQGHEAEPHMTFLEFKMIIDQVKHHTNQVALGGRGDPNLHPAFENIVKYARENNVVPNYTTSGIGLTKKQIEISKMCGAVAVSDYGMSYTYAAITSLANAGIKTNIHLIFTKQNYDKIINLLYGYNPWKNKIDLKYVNAVIFLLFKPTGAGKGKVDMIPLPHQIQAFSELLFSRKGNLKVGIGMDSCLANHVVSKVKLNPLQQASIDTCEAARCSTYISPSFRMVPCSFANQSKWGVDIEKRYDIKYIWNRSRPFKKFRSMLRKTPNKCPLGL